MQTKAKSNSVITHAVDESGNVITFNVLGAGTVAFDIAKASEACRVRAETHGWIQRLSDAAAISRNPETGQPATATEKMEAIAELAEYYMAGGDEWKRVATGSTFGKSSTLQAIANVTKTTLEQATAYVDKMAKARFNGDTKATLAYLRKGERVMAEMERLRKLTMKAPVLDADAALTELTA